MKRLFILTLVLMLTAAASGQTTGAPSFSADMKMTSKNRGENMAGKMYMSAGKMRMDMSTDGGKMSMISDPAKKTSYMVMHDQKMYMEMSADGPMGRGPMGRGPKMPDVKQMGETPCAGRSGVTCTKVGSEMMNGRMCDKWEIAGNKSESGTVWVDQKTHMPIKSVTGDGNTWELTNFQEGPQAASLFAPPPGYEKFDMGQMMRRQ